MKYAVLVLFILIGVVFHRFHWASGTQVEVLPDNPLYYATVLRDKLILRLLTDPIKRLEYYLILSERGVNVSRKLFEKGNMPLTKQTILRAGHYVTLLVTDYSVLTLTGEKIALELEADIQKTIDSHRLLNEEMLDKASESDAATITLVLDFLNRNEQKFLTAKQSKP